MNSSTIYVLIAAGFLAALFSKKFMRNETWRATMTPLASIIGSGFLIAAPILNELGGTNAPYLMAGLCLSAFCIGQVLRWNIGDVESALQNQTLPFAQRKVESLSDLALGLAYILSITYYLYLFSSFLLRLTGYGGVELERVITTFVLWGIVYFGHQNGLRSLEKVEAISVNLKLAIIFTFLCALAYFSATHSFTGSELRQPTSRFSWEKIQVGLGLLIMVQGFETSRYLGEKYTAETRIKSMRYAQYLSSIIYLCFIFFFIPVFQLHPLTGTVSETSVIDVGKFVFQLAPLFLLIAAIASQLSAAVADTGGAGGLFSEFSRNKLSPKTSYLLIGVASTMLIWMFDIFEVISLASRAFALYYCLQCLNSVLANFDRNLKRALFSGICLTLCLAVLLFGRSFES